jgi:hypothetical protein
MFIPQVSLACACLMVGTAAQAPEWGQAFGPGRLAALRQMILDSPDPQLIANLQDHMTLVQTVQATNPTFALGPSGRGADMARTNPTIALGPSDIGAHMTSPNPMAAHSLTGARTDMASTNPTVTQAPTKPGADVAHAARTNPAIQTPAGQTLMEEYASPVLPPYPAPKLLLAEPMPEVVPHHGQEPTSPMPRSLLTLQTYGSVVATSPMHDEPKYGAASSVQGSMPKMADVAAVSKMANVSMEDLSPIKQAAVAAMQSAGASPAWLEAYKGVLAWGYDTIMGAVMYDR